MKKAKVVLLAASALLAIAFIGCTSSGSASQKNPEKGFKDVKTHADKLQELSAKMAADYIVSAVGIGESKDLQTARSISADMARTELAVSLNNVTERLGKVFTDAPNEESRRLWQEAVRNTTLQELKGAKVRITQTQVNEATEVYRVFSLIVLEPELYKKAIEATLAAQKDLELRFNASEAFKELDTAVSKVSTHIENYNK